MPWIIMVPPDEIGGSVQVVAIDPKGTPYTHHWPPFVFTRRNMAVKYAQRFRCGIVIKTDGPLKLPTSAHEREKKGK
jgi:hypothetical protein